MMKIFHDVTTFHHACGVPIAVVPMLPPQERVSFRQALIDEEVNRELLPAMERGDLVEIADAMVDSIYVIVGAGLEYGIPLREVWNVVQKANMAKVDPKTGHVRRRADGKILKPSGWTAPDVAAVLVRAGWLRGQGG